MADLGSTTLSQTDANNGSGTMPSWSGTAAPSTLDDAGRALQGAVAREWNWRSYTLTASGTNTKTLSYAVAPAAYYNGQRFSFLNGTTVTGATTLNVNSLGAKTIKKMVSGTATDLASGDMVGGAYVEVAYNTAGDYFVWVNYVPNYGTIASQDANNVAITGGSITGITDLAVADGGTGASTAADARTNLGLGTMATQAASSVSISGGSITGITDLAVADGGTGASTAADARTNLGLGTGDSPQFAGIELGNASDTTITRSAGGVIAVEGGVVPKENRQNTFTVQQFISTGASDAIQYLSANAGKWKYVQMRTGTSPRWTIGSLDNAETGSNAGSDFRILRYDDAGGYLADAVQINRSSGLAQLESLNVVGNTLVTGTGGLGYGTGSGGTVTQTGTRSTGVTINKTNGSITLVSAAGSTSWKTFTVTNSTVAATDTVIVSQKSGTDNYQIFVTRVAAGAFDITCATTSGTTNEQPVFNFAVIKAVTS